MEGKGGNNPTGEKQPKRHAACDECRKCYFYLMVNGAVLDACYAVVADDGSAPQLLPSLKKGWLAIYAALRHGGSLHRCDVHQARRAVRLKKCHDADVFVCAVLYTDIGYA